MTLWLGALLAAVVIYGLGVLTGFPLGEAVGREREQDRAWGTWRTNVVKR
jgi:hypothetical protein